MACANVLIRQQITMKQIVFVIFGGYCTLSMASIALHRQYGVSPQLILLNCDSKRCQIFVIAHELIAQIEYMPTNDCVWEGYAIRRFQKIPNR